MEETVQAVEAAGLSNKPADKGSSYGPGPVCSGTLADLAWNTHPEADLITGLPRLARVGILVSFVLPVP